MYEFMPLAQVNTPEFVYALILKFSIAKFDFVPKEAFFVAYFNTSECYTPFLPNFENSNYPSTNFFYNQADIFILIFILLLILLVVSLLHLVCRHRTNYFLTKVKSFRYNAILRLVAEEYLPVVVPALMTLKTVYFSN